LICNCICDIISVNWRITILKLIKQEKEMLENLRNISGENQERIANVLKALSLSTLMNYADDEHNIFIPYFGCLHIVYKGDIIVDNKREADLDIQFFPSSYLKLNIGEIEDIKKNGNTIDIMKIPIINEISKDIENGLRNIIDGTTDLNDEENNG